MKYKFFKYTWNKKAKEMRQYSKDLKNNYSKNSYRQKIQMNLQINY